MPRRHLPSGPRRPGTPLTAISADQLGVPYLARPPEDRAAGWPEAASSQQPVRTATQQAWPADDPAMADHSRQAPAEPGSPWPGPIDSVFAAAEQDPDQEASYAADEDPAAQQDWYPEFKRQYLQMKAAAADTRAPGPAGAVTSAPPPAGRTHLVRRTLAGSRRLGLGAPESAGPRPEPAVADQAESADLDSTMDPSGPDPTEAVPADLAVEADPADLAVAAGRGQWPDPAAGLVGDAPPAPADAAPLWTGVPAGFDEVGEVTVEAADPGLVEAPVPQRPPAIAAEQRPARPMPGTSHTSTAQPTDQVSSAATAQPTDQVAFVATAQPATGHMPSATMEPNTGQVAPGPEPLPASTMAALGRLLSDAGLPTAAGLAGTPPTADALPTIDTQTPDALPTAENLPTVSGRPSADPSPADALPGTDQPAAAGNRAPAETASPTGHQADVVEPVNRPTRSAAAGPGAADTPLPARAVDGSAGIGPGETGRPVWTADPGPPSPPRPSTPSPADRVSERVAVRRQQTTSSAARTALHEPSRSAVASRQPMVAFRLPGQVATGLATVLSADVSATRVYRGPRVNESARSMRARAFTQHGSVFLPDEAGPLDSTVARSLIAHELTHVLQHQHGAGPVAESSVHPDELEQQALAVELAVAGGQPMPALSWRHPVLAEPGPAGEQSPLNLTQPAAHIRRAATDLSTTAPAAGLSNSPDPQPGGDLGADRRTGSDRSPDPALSPSAEQLPAAHLPASPPGYQQALAELSARLDDLGGELRQALVVSDDLDEAALARRLYGHLHGQLRHELILERERAGRLVQY
ncbi:MAG: eCIS core domain-containing protein [Jatrophihabitans sp.]